MQIEDGSVVKFLSSVLGVVATALSGLYWYIWRGDRARLKILEDQMQHVATMPQVKEIVDEIKHEFKDEHKTLLHAIKDGNSVTREYIKDMLEARQAHWNGRDRRKN